MEQSPPSPWKVNLILWGFIIGCNVVGLALIFWLVRTIF